MTPWLERSWASKNIHRQTYEYHITLENGINVIPTPFGKKSLTAEGKKFAKQSNFWYFYIPRVRFSNWILLGRNKDNNPFPSSGYSGLWALQKKKNIRSGALPGKMLDLGLLK